jgi:hypothetical protein
MGSHWAVKVVVIVVAAVPCSVAATTIGSNKFALIKRKEC